MMMLSKVTPFSVRKSIIIGAFMSFVPSAWSAAFTCDDTLYIEQSKAVTVPSLLNTIDRTATPYTFSAIGNAQIPYNAIGYNPIDNYIYGVKTPNSNYLLRIDSTGVVTDLGAITGLPAVYAYTSGAFDNNGNYYVKSFLTDNKLYKVNVTTTPATATLITLDKPVHIGDLAYTSNDDLLWAVEFNGDQQTLVSINPNTGAVNKAANTMAGLTTDTAFGALFSSSDGSIYGNFNAGASSADNGFYQFDKTTGQAILLSKTQGAGATDGANCATVLVTFPTDLAITKDDNDGSFQGGDTQTYTITVTNKSKYGVVGATVTDALPAGIPSSQMTYAVTSTSGGATSSISGTQTGAMNDTVTLPSGSTIVYTVTIVTPADMSVDLVNTATVTPPASRVDSDLTNNTATDTDKLLKYNMVKTVDKTNVSAPTALTYTFAFSNMGNVALTNLSVTDNNLTSAIDCGNGATTIASLTPNASASCSATRTVTQADIDSGADIVNNAATSATDTNGTAVNESDTTDNTAATKVSQNAAYNMVKTVDKANVNAPTTLTYTFAFSNTGNVALTNLSVTDNNLTSAIDCGNGATTIASLAPNASASCSATRTVTQADINSGADIVNNATTSATDANGTAVNESDTTDNTATTAIVSQGSIAPTEPQSVPSLSLWGMLIMCFSMLGVVMRLHGRNIV